MRFVLHNPHSLWYKTAFYQFNNKLKSVDKYQYFFNYLYNKKNTKIYVYLDKFSSNPPFIGSFRRFNTPLLEFYVWVLINKLNPFRFLIVKNIENLNKDDVLITFLYDNFTNLSGTFIVPRMPLIEKYKKIKAFKVVHLSHYGYNVALGSNNTRVAGIDLFIAENNLAKNSKFFRHYYPWYRKDIYVLPFVPQKRFLKKTNFMNRKNKALATGTLTYPITDKYFIEFFNDDKLQPMRYIIYQNASSLKEFIDSYITDIRVNSFSANKSLNYETRKKNNFYSYLFNSFPMIKYYNIIIRNIKHVFNDIKSNIEIIIKIVNAFCKKTQFENVSNDREYYHFDIVEKYNEYKMFIVPEEIIDLPGIGFVEGMACGAAYIGKRDTMYSDLGLIDKIHYIGYDGTLKDLIKKISYYQLHNEELEIIAENGYNFVLKNFNEDVVSKRFHEYIEKEIQKRN